MPYKLANYNAEIKKKFFHTKPVLLCMSKFNIKAGPKAQFRRELSNSQESPMNSGTNNHLTNISESAKFKIRSPITVNKARQQTNPDDDLSKNDAAQGDTIEFKLSKIPPKNPLDGRCNILVSPS
jgi:hypothetical protein